MTKIGIDYTAAYEQGGGIGRYVRELTNALASVDKQTDYQLFVVGASQSTLPPTPDTNFQWKSTRIPPRWLARIWHRLQIPAPIELFTGDLELFHATDFVLPPTRKTTKTILTVHDLSFVHVPEAASPRLKAYLDVVVPRSIHRATHVLADSQATKDDIVSLYHVSPEKITVLLSGVGNQFKPQTDGLLTIRSKYNIPARPFIFSIGTVQPRKNYARLIESLAQLRNRNIDIDLVIAGGKGWLENPIYQRISDLKLQNHVHFIGFADDTDLPALYSAAHCVAFPSLYEGFGFPVLEGMACGTPVLTSNISSLPEVAGDAAIMIDPYDVDAITDSLQRIIEDESLREKLVTKGFEQIKHFTWEKSARHLHTVYHQVLSNV